MKRSPNLNALWGSLIIEEMVRCGVRHFVYAPGSRSAPLIVALARHRQARARRCYDERAAAYQALGLARATDTPAVVITTSGTAVANLVPAVVEASLDRVPLIILTADRPPELHETGANQTIRQNTLFGDYLRWRFDLPIPDDRITARMVLTCLDQAWARAAAGPVQINCPFREPLAPREEPWDSACLAGLEDWQKGRRPFTGYTAPADSLPAAEIEPLLEDLRGTRRGMIIAGSLPTEGDRQAVRELVERVPWPVYCDITSGLRLGLDRPGHLHLLEHLLHQTPVRDLLRTDTVLQFGGRLTSSRVLNYLDQRDLKNYLLIAATPDRLDPLHRLTRRLPASPAAWWAQVRDKLNGIKPHPELERLEQENLRLEEIIQQALDQEATLSEPAVARLVSAMIPAGQALFVASSMPIRDLGNYAVRGGTAATLGTNRGASGIDGTIASAVGFGLGQQQPLTLLIGDLAFLHDLNSLTLLKEAEQQVIIILINNGGGGIFQHLSIAEYSDVFSPYFDTPHSYEFSGLAGTFGLEYSRVESRAELQRSYSAGLRSDKSWLIEVRTDSQGYRQVEERIRAAVMTGSPPGGI